MGLFSRGGLPREVFTSLVPVAGDKPHVLAWAVTGSGYAVALADRLVWSVPGGWAELGWHEIRHGGWRPAESELYWTTTQDEEGSLRLLDAGSLPPVFADRVEATILFRTTFAPADTSREVTITGRRALGEDATITWSWTPASGATLTPTALESVEREVFRIAAEYDSP